MTLVQQGVAVALAAGVVVPALPKKWAVPPARQATIDYALPGRADAWLRHPILGDPSFDSFVRRRGNPIVRGTAPFLWPVNTTFLIDPVSGSWYAYIGFYYEGYALAPGGPPTHCRIYRSLDKGRTWTEVGPAFDDPTFRFEGDEHPASIAPDAQVVYHAGRYHMSYDWATDNTTWANASAPAGGADSGLAYAWAERPEGPFHRAPRPILRTSEVQVWNGGSRRYCRAYATSLIRRRDDWLVIADLDSGAHYAWGQIAVTAKDPMGPWSAPVMIAGLEGDTYYPAPVEAFPSFVHGGYVYDPRTSVGLNRNFQIVMRAPIEEAHRPEAWSLYQHGSVWHASPERHEGFGIWGQTLAVQVADDGMHALFPSRHIEDGSGTINAASRPWSRPFRRRGFTMTAHGARSMTALRAVYGDFELDATIRLESGTARVVWAYNAPLGVEGRADGRPAAVVWSRHLGCEITRSAWRLVRADANGLSVSLAEGALKDNPRRALRLTQRGGNCMITIDGRAVWNGALPCETGVIGLLLEPHTHLTVDRFAISGVPRPASQLWPASEAISGAGVAEGSYETRVGPQWHAGAGAVCRTPRERAKWNFRGRGFRLWSPRGPEYGRVALLLDGKPLGTVDLHATDAKPSTVIAARTNLPDGFHALVLKADDRPLPLDCLEADQ